MFKFKKKSIIYVACLGILLLLLTFLTPLLKPALNTLKYPLSFLNLIRREIKGVIFYHRNFLQNEKLKKEIDFLRQELISLNEIELENQRFKKLLSFKEKSSFKVIAAGVIGRSADNWSSIIIINKGSFHGIKRGMVAITYLGLVGRVFETTKFVSKIMLINDPNVGVSGIVQRSRQEGLVTGALANYLVMKYLPKEADIKISDVIITSGFTEMYPKGILIGQVFDMGEEFSGLTRYALIKPAVDLSNLEEVLIIVQ